MERNYKMQFYDMDGEVGIVLISEWTGSAVTNMHELEKRTGSTAVNSQYELVGEKDIEDLTENALRTMINVFELYNVFE